MANGRIFKVLFFALIMCILLFAHSILSADTISEITRLQQSIKTMRSEFIQEKHSELLEKPIISKGVFYFSSPEKILWDYNEGIKVVSDGIKLIIYYKELKEADVLDVARLPSLPGSFSVERLKERYRIEILKTKAGRYLLKLLPVIKSMPFREMTISLDERGAPLEVRMIERTGDSTVIRFVNIQVNIPLIEEPFSMRLPEGTRIRKHLGNE